MDETLTLRRRGVSELVQDPPRAQSARLAAVDHELSAFAIGGQREVPLGEDGENASEIVIGQGEERRSAEPNASTIRSRLDDRRQDLVSAGELWIEHDRKLECERAETCERGGGEIGPSARAVDRCNGRGRAGETIVLRDGDEILGGDANDDGVRIPLRSCNEQRKRRPAGSTDERKKSGGTHAMTRVRTRSACERARVLLVLRGGDPNVLTSVERCGEDEIDEPRAAGEVDEPLTDEEVVAAGWCVEPPRDDRARSCLVAGSEGLDRGDLNPTVLGR
jgi:hypothetical protein